MPVMDTDYLAGPQEIAVMFDINKSTANNWYLRPGYPLPEVTHLSRGPLYDMRKIVNWWINWVPGKGHEKVGSLDEDLLRQWGIVLEQREQENGQAV